MTTKLDEAAEKYWLNIPETRSVSYIDELGKAKAAFKAGASFGREQMLKEVLDMFKIGRSLDLCNECTFKNTSAIEDIESIIKKLSPPQDKKE